jgi:hypothetical protein
MNMAKFKRVVEVSFLVLASLAVLAQAFRIFLGWRHGRLIQDEIRKGSRVSVLKINPRFPPGLLVEFDNSSRWTIPEIHFRVVFARAGKDVARADRDFGEIKPGEQKKILLQSVALGSSPPVLARVSGVKYRLLVFPGYRKPLPEITGEVDLLPTVSPDNQE